MKNNIISHDIVTMYSDVFNEFDEELTRIGASYEWKRLYSCRAWHARVADYEVLVSYNSIVAFYDYLTDRLIVRGRYSMTTYQHIRKFRNLMGYSLGIKPWDIEEINLELVNWFH